MIRGMFVQYMLALSFDSSAISLWFYRLKLCSHVWCFPRGQCDVRILGWRWASLVDWGGNNPGNVQSRVALRNHSPLDFCWGASVNGANKRLCDEMYETAISNKNRIHSWVTSYDHMNFVVHCASSMKMMEWWSEWSGGDDIPDAPGLIVSSIQTFKQPDDSKKLIAPCRCSRFHHSNHFLILI